MVSPTTCVSVYRPTLYCHAQFTCIYSFADVAESDEIPVVIESDETQDVTEEAVLMDLDDDYDDDDVFDHDAYGKCDACTVLLHYIPPNPEIYRLRSILNFYL